MLFLSIVSFNANAQELYRVSDYQLTGECENIFEEYGHDTFEIRNATHSLYQKFHSVTKKLSCV